MSNQAASVANLDVSDIRVFVPAKDFEVSKRFYVALGWKVQWSDDGLAVLELANQRFYLQNYYVEAWANNFMLHIGVADAYAWHAHVSAVLTAHNFPNARVAAPKHEDYGALVIYVWDPSGVLLHFTQWDKE